MTPAMVITCGRSQWTNVNLALPREAEVAGTEEMLSSSLGGETVVSADEWQQHGAFGSRGLSTVNFQIRLILVTV